MVTSARYSGMSLVQTGRIALAILRLATIGIGRTAAKDKGHARCYSKIPSSCGHIIGNIATSPTSYNIIICVALSVSQCS